MALTKASLIDLNGQELILDADGDTSITADTDDQIDFKTAGSDRVTINASGSLLIGNTDGTGIVNVNNGSGDGGYVHFANNVGATTLTNNQGLAFGWNKSNGGGESVIIANQGAGTSGGLAFATNTSAGSYTERMRISGNNLHLNGGTDARIQLGTGGAGANQVSNNTVHIRGDGASMKLMVASGGSYLYEVNGTERMRLDTNGKLTLAADAGYIADDSSGILQLRAHSTAGGWGISARGYTNTTTGYWYIGKQLNGTNIFSMTSDSDSIDLNFLSDERMKMNITDSADVLDKVKQITVKDFDWRTELNGDTKDDTRPSKEYGFIAQNFQDIGLGQYVKELMPTDESDDTLGMDYGNITPILVKAIQEQQAQIEALQSEINTLKGE